MPSLCVGMPLITMQYAPSLMPGVTSTFYSGILGVTVESGHTRVKVVWAY